MLPQCPRSHRNEAQKVEFLYQAVVGEPRASAPLSRASEIDSDFQTLFTALHASLHQHHEEAAARKSDGFSYRSRTAFQTDILINAGPSSPPRMFFQGQCRYSNPRQPGSKSSAPAHHVKAHYPTPAADYILKPGQPVRVYREKDEAWFGPFSVREVIGKKVTVCNSNGKLQEFSLHQVKPVLTPTNSNIDSHNSDQSILHTMLTDFVSEEHKLNIPGFGVYISEPVSNSDPRASSPQFSAVKKKEIDGLVEKVW
jgi:hypothetical protein